MTGAVEVELKFHVRDAEAAARYPEATELFGFVPVGPATTVVHDDRYVDTADGALARAGLAARLRTMGAETVVTVKSRPEARGAGRRGARPYRREELEGPADPALPPRAWPPSEARDRILGTCGDAPLVELARMRQRRRQRVLRDGSGTDPLVELSLDDVEVLSADRVVGHFTELEVELLRGTEERLAELGERLAADPALTPAHASKLDAATALTRS